MCLSKAGKLGEAHAHQLTWAEPQASNVWLSLGNCTHEHTWHWCALAHTCAHNVLDALLVVLVCPVCPTRHLTSREPLACCTAPPLPPSFPGRALHLERSTLLCASCAVCGKRLTMRVVAVRVRLCTFLFSLFGALLSLRYSTRLK